MGKQPAYNANFFVPGATSPTGRPQEHYENLADASVFAQRLADVNGEAVVYDREGREVARFARVGES
jgi:hypothetical protein